MARVTSLLVALGLLYSWNATFAGALHSQKPLFTSESESVVRQATLLRDGGVEVDSDGWDLGIAPPSNSTAHLVFSTVQNLLQHWPNTRYRNGHNLVPATVPVGTLLYHGTYHNALPDHPDWVATDPEHSYHFCTSLVPNSGCWHATLVASRPLKVLYFDGSSAAKMLGGPMDSQDLLVWDKVRPDKVYAEFERITELCRWGKEVGLDGFVRMEMDFEIMLCDFTAGVEVVSLLNLAGTTEKQRKRPQFRSFRVIETGSWHNFFPGETRIHLDYTRLISFYDATLFPSLVQAREGQSRLEHRLEGLSEVDTKVLKKKLDETVRGDWERKSGVDVDWKSLLNTVTERFAERLELLAYTLNKTLDEPQERALKAHRQISSMLDFYALRTAVPPNTTSTTGELPVHEWAQPVFAECATTHTRWLEQTPGVSSKLTDSERLILRSVQGVQKEICRVLVGMWAEGVELGLLKDVEDEGDLTEPTVPVDLSQKWLERTDALMQWLDWNYWLRCRPACGYEEMCYLPTWPFFFRGPIPPPPGVSRFMDRLHSEWSTNNGHVLGGDDEEEYTDPQPRCIRRLEPFSLDRQGVSTAI